MLKKREQPYPIEFKESSVKLALESNRPISKTAEVLGINSNTLCSWIRKQATNKVIQMKGSHEDEIKRLKQELFQVTQERDLLKKAAAYFAKESR